MNNSIKEIHIWDFPNKIFIELPDKYRYAFFTLALINFGGIINIKNKLKKQKLPSNLSRWKTSKDKNITQLCNLDVILFLINYVTEMRIDVQKAYTNVKLQLNQNIRRIPKSNDHLFLINILRLLVGGNENLAKSLNINPSTLRESIRSNRIKKLSIRLVSKILIMVQNEILAFSFTLNELEDNVLSYKYLHSKKIYPFNKVRKLPILVTPEFESLIYHLMGDGYVPEGGSGEYTQLNKISRSNFLLKLFNIFGKFSYSKDGFNNGRVYISRTILKILCNYYKLNYSQFLWDRSRIPEELINSTNFSKLSGLLAFIVDEGYVGKSSITLHSGNQSLLNQIRNLAFDLGLKCSEVKVKRDRTAKNLSYRFNINKEGVIKLFNETLKLQDIYPTCNLAHKGEKILKIVNSST
jgi:hypothetical protein